MSPSWSTRRERGHPSVLRLLGWLTIKVGWRTGHVILYGVTLYFFLFSDRGASRRFLRTALGREPTLVDIYRHYFCFATTILDRSFVLQSRLEGYKINVEGLDMVRAFIARGQGCILLGAHLGSFEILRALADQATEIGCPVPVKVLMYGDNASRSNAVFAAINPARLDDIIKIGAPDTMLRVKEALDQGALVGILGDRVPAGEKVLPASFMGHEARLAVGPFILASVLKAPVILFYGILRGGRRYDIHFELMAEQLTLGRTTRQADLAAWVQLYATKLEERALDAPFNWFNFYDFWDQPDGAAAPARPGHGAAARHDAAHRPPPGGLGGGGVGLAGRLRASTHHRCADAAAGRRAAEQRQL